MSAAEARRLLRLTGDGGNLVAEGCVAVAQVEATLALVEQHRIANLVAIANSPNLLGVLGDTEVMQALTADFPDPDEPDFFTTTKLSNAIAQSLGIDREVPDV